MAQRHALIAAGALLLYSCAGANRPTYEFGPTLTPLRYEIAEHGDLSIETPMGMQNAIDSTHATVVIEIGRRSEAGHRVSVTFEALELWDVGDFNDQHVQGGDLLSRPFSGILSPQGVISVTAAPEVPASLATMVDPKEMIADLLPPLPPTGKAPTDTWTHTRAANFELTMSIETRYEGSARFAGDTTWNGIPARVIVSEGTVETRARGTPPGAPGEIEMAQGGSSMTLYIWDAGRGVMLASRSTVEADGSIEVISMGMTMPVIYKGVREVRLLQ